MPITRPGSLFAILDRDGTINANIPYLGNPDELALLPGTVRGLRRLAEAGFRLIIAPLQQKASFLPRLPKWSSARIWPQQLEFGPNNWPQQ
jgi:hypothetical protein